MFRSRQAALGLLAGCLVTQSAHAADLPIKAKAIEYEEYLKRIAELAKRVEAGQAEETPKTLHTPGRRALYNNLGHNEDLALRIDEAVKTARPDGWRGVQAREQVVKKALYDVLQDVNEVERIFLIIKAQREY